MRIALTVRENGKNQIENCMDKSKHNVANDTKRYYRLGGTNGEKVHGSSFTKSNDLLTPNKNSINSLVSFGIRYGFKRRMHLKRNKFTLLWSKDRLRLALELSISTR